MPQAEMQNVPKIVRERLKAAKPGEHHLDADMLTAFAERSLPDRERTAVVEHLASCGDCRDVLALAVPETETAQTVMTPTRGGRLTWPVLRWGFIAAAGIAIVSLGIVQYQRHLPPATMVAKQTKPEAVATDVQAQPGTPSSAAGSAETQEKSLAAAPSSGETISRTEELKQGKLVAPAQAPKVSTRQLYSVGGVVAGTAALARPSAVLPSAAAREQAADTPLTAQIPPVAETVEAQAPSVASPVGTETKKSLQLEARPLQPQQEFDYSAGAVGKAKLALNAPASNASPAVGGPMPQPGSNARRFVQLSNQAAPPSWTISPSGGLQRSFDQGQTWQDVDVNAGSANGYTSLAVVAKTAPGKDSLADRKISKEPGAAFVFRAVAAIGPEVWAGGSGGVLYHSLDAGGHWVQVAPSANGATLTGDVISLGFPDAQHVNLTTSTPEIWTTTDAGQTWQKQ